MAQGIIKSNAADIDTIWGKLLSLVGYRSDFKFSDLLTDRTNPSGTILYVTTTGKDTGLGTVSNPIRTWEEAWRRQPDMPGGLRIIKFGAGTFEVAAEQFGAGGWVCTGGNPIGERGDYVLVEGEMETVASCTATSEIACLGSEFHADGVNVTVPGDPEASSLRGMYCRFTSGPLTDQVFQIAENASGKIWFTVPAFHFGEGLSGATFEVEKPATIIDFKTGVEFRGFLGLGFRKLKFQWGGEGGALFLFSGMGQSYTNCGVVMEQVHFNGLSAADESLCGIIVLGGNMQWGSNPYYYHGLKGRAHSDIFGTDPRTPGGNPFSFNRASAGLYIEDTFLIMHGPSQSAGHIVATRAAWGVGHGAEAALYNPDFVDSGISAGSPGSGCQGAVSVVGSPLRRARLKNSPLDVANGGSLFADQLHIIGTEGNAVWVRDQGKANLRDLTCEGFEIGLLVETMGQVIIHDTLTLLTGSVNDVKIGANVTKDIEDFASAPKHFEYGLAGVESRAARDYEPNELVCPTIPVGM